MTAVDLGCGDFSIGRQIAPHCGRYIGVDIVRPLIDHNRSTFGCDRITFRHADIIEGELPGGDICFVRQVFQHLSNAQILTILPKLAIYRWCFITEHHPSAGLLRCVNIDKPQGADIRLYRGSGVFLESPPFNVPRDDYRLILEAPGQMPDHPDPGVIRTFVWEPHAPPGRRKLLLALILAVCVGLHPASRASAAELRIASPTALPAATSGGTYFYPMAVSGGTPPYNWSLVSASGSTAWVMTPEGWLEAAPTTGQRCSVTIAVADSANQIARATFSVTVNGSLAVMNQDLATGRISLPPAVSGNAYVHRLLAAGGTQRYTWSIASGSLPPGLGLSSNGIVSGTPTASGRFDLVLSVSDSARTAATANATLLVSAADRVARPPYNASDGFFVYQGRLYDPTGSVFRIRGVNRVHFDNPDQPGMMNAQVNAVRFFMYNIGVTGTQPATTYRDLAVQQNIAYGELPIVTAANVAGLPRASTGDASTSDLASMVSWWVSNESAFAPVMNRIAINIANEWGPAHSADWATAYERAIAALRAAGYTCPLLIDTGGSGQDIDDLLDYASKVFNSDPEKNIIFSFHFYGLGKAYPPGSTLTELRTITSQLATLAHSTGAAFIVGEFGPGRKIGPSPTDLTPGQIIAAAEANNLGWLAWAWDDNDQGGCNSDDYSFSMTYHCGEYLAPSRLTHYGLDVALNPAYGWIALASPASFFIADRHHRAGFSTSAPRSRHTR